MAGTYQRWLIARGNVFMPSAVSIVKLLEQLRAERWIPTEGGHAITTVEKAAGVAAARAPLPAAITKEWLEHPDREEIRLVWPVEGEAGLHYPLTHTPEGPPSYRFELHRALEYVYPGAPTIGALPSECACGEDLAFEWDEDELVPAFQGSTGIFAECDECSRTFDPARKMAQIANPFDGSKEEVAGGAAYRFALKIDTGPRHVESAEVAFSRELVALVEKEFGRSFYEIAAHGQ